MALALIGPTRIALFYRPDKAITPPSGTVLRLLFRQESFQDNHCGADTDRTIGEVKRSKMPVPNVEIDHIDHETMPQAVEQVPQRAAND